MQKTILGVGSLVAILGGILIFSNNSQAYRGDPNVKGTNYSEERHTAMEKAFDSNDYEAWKNLMEGRGRVTQVINKDNFSKFAEAHRLAENGDIEGSKKIREELGLGLKDGSGKGYEQGQNREMGNCQNR